MEESVQVRIGTPHDLDGVMALAHLIHAEIGVTDLSIDKVLPDVWAALNRDRGVMGVIGPVGGELQAGILLRIGKPWYSDEDAIEDKGLFVRPEYRVASRTSAGHGQLPHAVRLCEFAKKTADVLGLPLFMGVQDPSGAKGKVRLYERQFGQPIGMMFLYRPSIAQSEAA